LSIHNRHYSLHIKVSLVLTVLRVGSDLKIRPDLSFWSWGFANLAKPNYIRKRRR